MEVLCHVKETVRRTGSRGDISTELSQASPV